MAGAGWWALAVLLAGAAVTVGRMDVGQVLSGIRQWVASAEAGGSRGRGHRLHAALGAVAVEVATRLRAGADLECAFERAWTRHPVLPAIGGWDADGVPVGLAALSGRAGRGADVRAAGALVAACRFSRALGAPIAQVMDAVAADIEDAASVEEARRIARAGPRMSARILTALPPLGIVLGEVAGAGSVGFLLGGGWPVACLGAVLSVAAHVVVRRMVRGIGGRDDTTPDPGLVADLAVVGLHSGAAVPRVLEALGEALGLEQLSSIAQRLLAGAPWDRAWAEAPPGVGILAEAMAGAWQDGADPTDLLVCGARRWRRERISRAKEDAEALGVRLVLPLGTLLLPAFVLLGIVPVVVHLGAGLPLLGGPA